MPGCHYITIWNIIYCILKWKKIKSCVDKSLPLRAQVLPAGAGDGDHDDDHDGVHDDDDDTPGSPDTPHTCNTRQVWAPGHVAREQTPDTRRETRARTWDTLSSCWLCDWGCVCHTKYKHRDMSHEELTSPGVTAWSWPGVWPWRSPPWWPGAGGRPPAGPAGGWCRTRPWPPPQSRHRIMIWPGWQLTTDLIIGQGLVTQLLGGDPEAAFEGPDYPWEEGLGWHHIVLAGKGIRAGGLHHLNPVFMDFCHSLIQISDTWWFRCTCVF